jgi:hypothetical protein
MISGSRVSAVKGEKGREESEKERKSGNMQAKHYY